MNDRSDDIVKPTRQRMRRAPGYDELTETQSGGVVRKSGAVRVWSQLENLYRNRVIGADEYQAGQKYYADWYLGTEQGSGTTMRWAEYISGLGGSGDMEAAERRVFHSRRYAKANEVLEAMGRRKLIHWLVCNDIPCEQIGRQYWGLKGKHTASGRAVGAAETALIALAKFYGLKK